jgi:hypothetical protein
MTNTVPKPGPPGQRWVIHDRGFAERCRACRSKYGPPSGPYPLDVAIHHQMMLREQYQRAVEDQ